MRLNPPKRVTALIGITDLMKYIYCPQIVYYEWVLKIPQPVTAKEKAGIAKQEVFSARTKRLKILKSQPKLPRQYNLQLSSERIGLQTKIDCVLFNHNCGEAYPLQLKNLRKPAKLYRGLVCQIIAEALLIEDCLGYRVPYGYINFLKSGQLIKLHITDIGRRWVRSIISSVHEIIIQEKLPASYIKLLRRDCGYRAKYW